jgi:hypothetical protein
MSKSSPQISASSEAVDNAPKQNWFNRNRGKIALLLGMALGYAANDTYRDIKQRIEDISKVADRLDDMGKTLGKLSELEAPVDPAVQAAINDMPDYCEIKSQSFFGDLSEASHLVSCDASSDSAPKTEEKLPCLTYSERMRKTAVKLITHYNFTDGSEEEIAIMPTQRKDFKRLDELPAVYREALRDLDPDVYEKLKEKVFVGVTPELSYAGAEGTVSKNVDLVDGRFVTSMHGKYNLSYITQEMEDFDVDQALQTGDERGVDKFWGAILVLTHEVYGHIQDLNNYPEETWDALNIHSMKKACDQKGIPRLIQSEIASYYMTHKMAHHLFQKHPKLKEYMRKKYENQHKKSFKTLCDEAQKRETAKADDEHRAVQFNYELHTEYEKAEASGDWQGFREHVIAKIMSMQFGLPYLIPYFKGRPMEAECYKGLNEKLKASLNSDSPEILLKK